MRRGNSFRLLQITWALCLFPSIAGATMLQKLDAAELTKASRWIHTGRVSSQWSSYDPDNRMVFTYTKLSVESTLKGEPQKEVLIRQAGGQTDNIGMVIHGVAHFEKGERALVFLRSDRDGAPTMVGMAQGKFKIIRSAKTGEDVAYSQIPPRVDLIQSNGGVMHRQAAHSSLERRVPMENLIREIRAAMKKP